jgi:hypothetical protein
MIIHTYKPQIWRAKDNRSGVSGHGDSPEAATQALMKRLQEVRIDWEQIRMLEDDPAPTMFSPITFYDTDAWEVNDCWHIGVGDTPELAMIRYLEAVAEGNAIELMGMMIVH